LVSYIMMNVSSETYELDSFITLSVY